MKMSGAVIHKRSRAECTDAKRGGQRQENGNQRKKKGVVWGVKSWYNLPQAFLTCLRFGRFRLLLLDVLVAETPALGIMVVVVVVELGGGIIIWSEVGIG